nr:hypothetical protein [Tanacetum cinerariifolium]
MNKFCTKKGIRREFSNARTPQQNRVAERKNKTLIEAARTMLADAKLPVTFWAEAVNTAFYVQNRVLVNKSQNKTPYELFNNRIPAIGFLRPFGSSKAFRVFNKRTKKVEENLHVDFLENKLIETGAGPNWLFDIDTLTNSMNYVPMVVAGTSSTNILGTKDVASQAVKKDVSSLRYIALPNCGISNPTTTSKVSLADQVEPAVSLTVEYEIPTVSSHVLNVCLDISPESSSGSRLISKRDFSQKETPSLGNALTLSNRFEDTFGVEADLSNMETSIPEEGIDYEEAFAPVAKIEAIRLFLTYASFIGFIVYQMDVKSASLYGTIDEEVYTASWISRPRVSRKSIQGGEGYLCREFETLMHDKFQMSAMGELTFFLRLQVLQKKDGIFLSQDKYVGDILKKFGYSDVRSAN